MHVWSQTQGWGIWLGLSEGQEHRTGPSRAVRTSLGRLELERLAVFSYSPGRVAEGS